MSLSDLLPDKTIKRIQKLAATGKLTIVKLKEILQEHHDELEQKGVLSDYLAYALAYKLNIKENPLRAMTYGEVPHFSEFQRAFDKVIPDGGYYRMELNSSDSKAAEFTIIGTGCFNAEELWIGAKQLVEKFNLGCEDAGSLASSILSTLGFEWV